MSTYTIEFRRAWPFPRAGGTLKVLQPNITERAGARQEWRPGEIRLVTSWDQGTADVDRLAAAIAAL